MSIFDQYSPIQLQSFMQKAYVLAEQAFDEGEVPVGALIVGGTKILGKAYNQVEKLKDPTAHAEMLAITSAASYLSGRHLQDCLLIVTLEPCAMCAGASYWSRVGGILFAAPDQRRGVLTNRIPILHPTTEIRKGPMEQECSDLVKSFFKQMRSS